jgi:hypothetical protein
LRFLHRQRDELEFLEIDPAGNFGADASTQISGLDLEMIRAPAYRETNLRPLRVDQIRLLRKTYERYVVAAHRELGREQRPVGRAEGEYVELLRHNSNRSYVDSLAVAALNMRR